MRQRPLDGGGVGLRFLLFKPHIQAKGDAPQALITLQRALSLAQPEGYARVFLDEGAPMRKLISDFGVWVEKQPGGARSENRIICRGT